MHKAGASEKKKVLHPGCEGQNWGKREEKGPSSGL